MANKAQCRGAVHFLINWRAPARHNSGVQLTAERNKYCLSFRAQTQVLLHLLSGEVWVEKRSSLIIRV
jgi:hypothetical protein